MSYAEWAEPFIGLLEVGQKVRVKAVHKNHKFCDDGIVVRRRTGSEVHRFDAHEEVDIRIKDRDLEFMRPWHIGLWHYVQDDPLQIGVSTVAIGDDAVRYEIRRYT